VDIEKNRKDQPAGLIKLLIKKFSGE